MVKLKNRLKVYTTSWCPDCRNAKRFLDSHKIEYDEIDIGKNSDAEAFVIKVSGGRRVIPTIDADGKYFFNPPLSTLVEELGINS